MKQLSVLFIALVFLAGGVGIGLAQSSGPASSTGSVKKPAAKPAAHPLHKRKTTKKSGKKKTAAPHKKSTTND